MIISSSFTSNLVGMENNKPKTKKQLIEMVDTVEDMIRDVAKMISKKKDISSIDTKLLEIAISLVRLSGNYKLLDRKAQCKFYRMVSYIKSIRISFGYTSFNEYKLFFTYIEKHSNIFG